MAQEQQGEGWVYVIICDEGESAHYLGLHDEDNDIDFIPAFPDKDAAQDCFLNMPREKGKKYEVQAVHIEELSEDAEKNGFSVAILEPDNKSDA